MAIRPTLLVFLLVSFIYWLWNFLFFSFLFVKDVTSIHHVFASTPVNPAQLMILTKNFDLHFSREVAKGLMKYQPDIIISVHPLMQHVPLRILRAKGLLEKIVFTTVVTDLSTCHPTWYGRSQFPLFYCILNEDSVLDLIYYAITW